MKPFTSSTALDDQSQNGLTDSDAPHHRFSEIINKLHTQHADGAPHEALFATLSELKQFVFDRHPPQDEKAENIILSAYQHLNDHSLSLLENNVRLQAEIAENVAINSELLKREQHYRLLAEHAHNWEYWEGPSGEIMYMSPSCERVTGYPPDNFINNPELLYSIIHPEDWYVMKDHKRDFRLTEDSRGNELGFRIVRPDGDIRWILHSCRAMHNEHGQYIGRKTSNRDTTNPGSRSDLMLLVASVFDAVNEAIVLTDEYSRIILVNATFTKITGYQLEEVIGQSPNLLAARRKSADALLESWEIKTVKGRWESERTHRRKNGETYVASASIDCVRDETGHVTNYLLVFSDINDQKANERKLHYLAHYDQLTGFPNWVLFNDRLRQAISASKRRKQMIALMFVDIDHFRATRDQIGHEKGDLLIQEVANRISRCIRDSDTAARIGNDEFAVLLKRVADAPAISAIADQILQATSEPVTVHDEIIHVSVSIGIAVYPEHGTTSEQLMRNADLATYHAKQEGGYAVKLFDDMNEWSQQLRLW